MRPLRLLQHLVELVDDHADEVAHIHLARHDHWQIVELLRIRDRPDRAAARFHAHGTVVVAPVERIAIAGLGEQVRRVMRLGDPRREPARRCHARAFGHARAAMREQCALALFVEITLTLRVRIAVSDQLVAASHACFDQLGAMIVERGIDERAGGHVERVE